MATESNALARFECERAKEQVRSIARAVGVSPGDAVLFADALIGADVGGTSTHGISRLNIYIRRIQAGLIDPRAALGVVREQGAVLVLDANNGLGQVQTLKALEKLKPLARSHGIAAATLRNSQHFGAVS